MSLYLSTVLPSTSVFVNPSLHFLNPDLAHSVILAPKPSHNIGTMWEMWMRSVCMCACARVSALSSLISQQDSRVMGSCPTPHEVTKEGPQPGKPEQTQEEAGAQPQPRH